MAFVGRVTRIGASERRRSQLNRSKLLTGVVDKTYNAGHDGYVEG